MSDKVIKVDQGIVSATSTAFGGETLPAQGADRCGRCTRKIAQTFKGEDLEGCMRELFAPTLESARAAAECERYRARLFLARRFFNDSDAQRCSKPFRLVGGEALAQCGLAIGHDSWHAAYGGDGERLTWPDADYFVAVDVDNMTGGATAMQTIVSETGSKLVEPLARCLYGSDARRCTERALAGDRFCQKHRRFLDSVSERRTVNRMPKPGPLDRIREWDMPFGPSFLDPGERATIDMQPRVYFQSERILFIGDEADGVTFESFTIGQRVQLGSLLPIIVDTSRSRLIELWDNSAVDCAEPALMMRLVAVNNTDRRRVFAGSIIGKALDQRG